MPRRDRPRVRGPWADWGVVQNEEKANSEGETAHEAAAAVGVVPPAAETFTLKYVTQRKSRLRTHRRGERGIRDNFVAAGVVPFIARTGHDAGAPRGPH